MGLSSTSLAQLRPFSHPSRTAHSTHCCLPFGPTASLKELNHSHFGSLFSIDFPGLAWLILGVSNSLSPGAPWRERRDYSAGASSGRGRRDS